MLEKFLSSAKAQFCAEDISFGLENFQIFDIDVLSLYAVEIKL